MKPIYIIFERPIGSKCWTVHHQEDASTFIGITRYAAEHYLQFKLSKTLASIYPNGKFVKDIEYHIHEVTNLPE